MKNVNSVLVVGGGTAGLISAIILKRKLDLKIDVVHSKNIGIIGVGEGSTEHFKSFLNFVGLDQWEIIKECDATYKSGIMFEGWTDNRYMHLVSGEFNLKVGQYSYIYANQIANRSNYLHNLPVWENLIDPYFLQDRHAMPFNQFHFNTHKLNDYLIRVAKQIGINVMEDDINDVTLNEQGEINFIQGEKQNYKYDFYIDATGFRKVLIGKLGAKWKSYSKYLKMNSAFVFPTEDTENYNIWTLAKAMKNGWMFRIPVWGRHGNGYIFSDQYTSLEDAKKEVDDLFGKEVNIGKKFQFDPGCLEECWIKNCCAVGLAAAFVEPLEATSIGTTIQQSFLLMHRLANYDDRTISRFNKSFSDIMENIRDFIVLHYITKRDDTQFWRDVAKIELPETLAENLEMWKTRLPIDEDFNKMSNYIMFKADNYSVVMAGLNLFDSEAIKREFNMHSQLTKKEAVNILCERMKTADSIKYITHKQFIEHVRNNFRS
jgi:flavin-dependent dehydrogenase